MDDTESRLRRCFTLAFPDIEEKQLRHATTDTLASWDSIANVTLINLIEEEFGAEMTLEDVEHLNSFEGYLAYMQTRVPAR
jgi:acyl carrier protein